MREDVKQAKDKALESATERVLEAQRAVMEKMDAGVKEESVKTMAKMNEEVIQTLLAVIAVLNTDGEELRGARTTAITRIKEAVYRYCNATTAKMNVEVDNHGMNCERIIPYQ